LNDLKNVKEYKHILKSKKKIPTLKGVFAKNEMGYKHTSLKYSMVIATNLASICCVYKEKIVKNEEERSVHTNINYIYKCVKV